MFYLTAEAAKILDVTPATVRMLERRGVLVSQRTGSGVRLFTREEVERVARDRAARRGNRGGEAA